MQDNILKNRLLPGRLGDLQITEINYIRMHIGMSYKYINKGGGAFVHIPQLIQIVPSTYGEFTEILVHQVHCAINLRRIHRDSSTSSTLCHQPTENSQRF